MGHSGDWVRDRPGEGSSSQDEDLANTVSCIQAMEKGNGIQDRNPSQEKPGGGQE